MTDLKDSLHDEPAALMADEEAPVSGFAAAGLAGMSCELINQLTAPAVYGDMPFVKRLSRMLDAHNRAAAKKRFENILRNSALRYKVPFSMVRTDEVNGPTLSTMEIIAAGEYLRAGTNWYISGNTGCGKTMLACAMGWRAAESGYSVKFMRVPELLHDLCICDDRWKKNLRGRLKRFHVLILDDYGIDMLSASRAEFLYNVAEDRYLRKPVIITTQIDFESRRDPVSDDSPHTGEALCDRLFPEGPAKRIKLTGPSRRGTKDEIRG